MNDPAGKKSQTMVAREVTENIVNAIRSVIGNEPAVLHEPVFEGNELKYVSDCVTSGWVSSLGSYVDRFEEQLQEITGAARAIACSNGTSALMMALKLAGVEHGDEVLIPAMTFVGTANAVVHCGAIPHLLDIEIQTLGIECSKAKQYLDEIGEIRSGQLFNRQTGNRLSAVVPVHCFGHPSQIIDILSLAEEFHLRVVEDAAESLGSFVGGRHTGTFGDLGILSFNGNKIVTTGGGGAILTNDAQMGNRAKHITTTAKVPHAWRFFHDCVGYNLRLPNLNAALGCAQLEQLDEFVLLKRNLAGRYCSAFASVNGVSFLEEPEHCHSNYWLNAILLDEEFASLRDDILEKTNEQQLMTRPAWELMHQLPMYRNCPRMNLAVAESVQSRLVNIPSGVKVARQSEAMRA